MCLTSYRIQFYSNFTNIQRNILNIYVINVKLSNGVTSMLLLRDRLLSPIDFVEQYRSSRLNPSHFSATFLEFGKKAMDLRSTSVLREGSDAEREKLKVKNKRRLGSSVK